MMKIQVAVFWVVMSLVEYQHFGGTILHPSSPTSLHGDTTQETMP